MYLTDGLTSLTLWPRYRNRNLKWFRNELKFNLTELTQVNKAFSRLTVIIILEFKLFLLTLHTKFEAQY